MMIATLTPAMLLPDGNQPPSPPATPGFAALMVAPVLVSNLPTALPSGPTDDDPGPPASSGRGAERDLADAGGDGLDPILILPMLDGASIVPPAVAATPVAPPAAAVPPAPSVPITAAPASVPSVMVTTVPFARAPVVPVPQPLFAFAPPASTPSRPTSDIGTSVPVTMVAPSVVSAPNVGRTAAALPPSAVATPAPVIPPTSATAVIAPDAGLTPKVVAPTEPTPPAVTMTRGDAIPSFVPPAVGAPARPAIAEPQVPARPSGLPPTDVTRSDVRPAAGVASRPSPEDVVPESGLPQDPPPPTDTVRSATPAVRALWAGFVADNARPGDGDAPSLPAAASHPTAPPVQPDTVLAAPPPQPGPPAPPLPGRAGRAPAVILPLPPVRAIAFTASVPAAVVASDADAPVPDPIAVPVAPSADVAPPVSTPAHPGESAPVIDSFAVADPARTATPDQPLPVERRDGGRAVADAPAATAGPSVAASQGGSIPAAVDAGATAAPKGQVPPIDRPDPLRDIPAVDGGRSGADQAIVSGTAQPVLSATPVSAAGPMPDPTAAGPSDAGATRRLDLAHDTLWLDRLAQDIVATASRDGELRFRLNPEHLGSLAVEVRAAADGHHVRLTAETEQARAFLADAQPRLVAEARAQGLTIAGAQVDLGRGQADARQQQPQQQHRAAPEHRAAASSPTVTVNQDFAASDERYA